MIYKYLTATIIHCGIRIITNLLAYVSFIDPNRRPHLIRSVVVEHHMCDEYLIANNDRFDCIFVLNTNKINAQTCTHASTQIRRVLNHDKFYLAKLSAVSQLCVPMPKPSPSPPSVNVCARRAMGCPVHVRSFVHSCVVLCVVLCAVCVCVCVVFGVAAHVGHARCRIIYGPESGGGDGGGVACVRDSIGSKRVRCASASASARRVHVSGFPCDRNNTYNINRSAHAFECARPVSPAPFAHNMPQDNHPPEWAPFDAQSVPTPPPATSDVAGRPPFHRRVCVCV